MEKEIKQSPEIDIITEEDITIGLACKVVLYNDDWHTFDEVITQLIKAVKCSFDEARDYAFEVHVRKINCIFRFYE